MRIPTWLLSPDAWRFIGFASTIVGLICYALSSSFYHLAGKWNLTNLLIYVILSIIICLGSWFAKLWQHSTLSSEAHLGFLVLTITSVYSFFFEKSVDGKPDALSLVSCVAFSIMSFSFSRQIHWGFEVDLLNFFLSGLIVQLMKIHKLLVIVGICFSYFLIILKRSLDATREKDYHDNQDQNHLAIEMGSLNQRRFRFEPSRKLESMKEYLAILRWYKKDSQERNIGYYDSYKMTRSTIDLEVDFWHKNLTLYWKRVVEEAEMKPEEERAAFHALWLDEGTNYRRMVEPLDIAEYYANGGKDYVNKGRSSHYKQLEQWLTDVRRATSLLNRTIPGDVRFILTLDSCFWAHVEEALLLCGLVKDEQSSAIQKEEAIQKLVKFEDYVYKLLKKYEVSPDIFLEGSSYMLWWDLYKKIVGTSYTSELAGLMSNAENYNVLYVRGTYNFS